MTRQEAENVMLAFRRGPECSVGRNGFRIIKYHGISKSGTHYFKCLDVDVKNPKPDDYVVFGVCPDGQIFFETR